MKLKMSLLTGVAALSLAGCATGQTDYEKFQSEMQGIQGYEQLTGGATATMGEKTVNVEVSVDKANQIEYVNLFGLEAYVDSKYSYVKLFGDWYKSEISDEEIEKLKSDLEFDIVDVDFELPDGETPVVDIIDEESLGVEEADAVLGTKTLNELVKETSDQVYVIDGITNIEVSTADDQLTYKFTGENDGTVKSTIGKGEEITIPDEAKNGKTTDELSSKVGAALAAGLADAE